LSDPAQSFASTSTPITPVGVIRSDRRWARCEQLNPSLHPDIELLIFMLAGPVVAVATVHIKRMGHSNQTRPASIRPPGSTIAQWGTSGFLDERASSAPSPTRPRGGEIIDS
jgi:hypothetical protein